MGTSYLIQLIEEIILQTVEYVDVSCSSLLSSYFITIFFFILLIVLDVYLLLSIYFYNIMFLKIEHIMSLPLSMLLKIYHKLASIKYNN